MFIRAQHLTRRTFMSCRRFGFDAFGSLAGFLPLSYISFDSVSRQHTWQHLGRFRYPRTLLINWGMKVSKTEMRLNHSELILHHIWQIVTSYHIHFILISFPSFPLSCYSSKLVRVAPLSIEESQQPQTSELSLSNVFINAKWFQETCSVASSIISAANEYVFSVENPSLNK